MKIAWNYEFMDFNTVSGLEVDCTLECSILCIYLAAQGLSCDMQGLFGCGIGTLSCSTGDLTPWPRMEPRPLVLGAQSLSQRITREVPPVLHSWPVKASSQPPSPWATTLVSLITSFFFDEIRCPWLILQISCTRPRISHFSNNVLFL